MVVLLWLMRVLSIFLFLLRLVMMILHFFNRASLLLTAGLMVVMMLFRLGMAVL